jgi:hypothetical protein
MATGLEQFLVIVDNARLYQVASASPTGVPSMAPVQPKLDMKRGMHLQADLEKKASERDSGDGIVHDSKGEAYLFILASPEEPRASGCYVSRGDVVRIAESVAMQVSPALEKTNLQFYLRQDKQGKPIFIPSRPMVKLKGGTQLRVSSTYRVSDKDPGDGTVLGSGREPYCLVVECPEMPAAQGLYVAKSDLTVD